MLDLFSESRPLWTLDELMQELGYTRPTLYRYLKSLKDCGLLMSTRGGATSHLARASRWII